MDREAAVWAITDAIAQRDLSRALSILHLLLEHGTEPLAIVGFLASHHRGLMQVAAARAEGLDKGQIAARTGLHPFRVGKMMIQFRDMRSSRLHRAVTAVAQADAILKRSKLGRDAGGRWLEQLLVALSRGRPLRQESAPSASSSL